MSSHDRPINDPVLLALRPLKVLPKKIPRRLKNLAQWVLWRLEPNEQTVDKPKKMPYQVNGKPAKANDPATWTTCDEAITAWRNSCKKTRSSHGAPFSGIGYVFSEDDGMVGVDLDNCRDPIRGSLETWAAKVVSRFDSYAEVSPSGTGVKIWCRGRLPINGTGRKTEYRGGAVELYEHGRYFAVTGHKLDDSPELINKAQEALDWLWAKAFEKPPYGATARSPSDPGGRFGGLGAIQSFGACPEIPCENAGGRKR